MHQIDDGRDAQVVDHVGNDLVGPAPVELAGLKRLQPIPGNSPAHHLEAEVAHQAEVFAPVLVMPDELVLVEGTVAGPGLGHKRVLDPGGPQEVLGTPTEDLSHG